MTESRHGLGGTLLRLALFLIVGAPFAYLAWEEFSELLSGRVEARGFAVLVGSLLVLLVVAAALKRWVQGLEDSP